MTATSVDATDRPPPTADPATMITTPTEIDRHGPGRQAGRTGDTAVTGPHGWNRTLATTARADIGRRLAPVVTIGVPKGPRPGAEVMNAAALVTNKRTGEAHRTAVLIHMAITGRRSTLMITIGRTAEAMDGMGIAATLARRPPGTLLIVRTATRTERRIETYPTGSRRTTITDAAILVTTASMPARRRTGDLRTRAMPTIMADIIAAMAIGGLRLVTVTKINPTQWNHRRSGFPA